VQRCEDSAHSRARTRSLSLALSLSCFLLRALSLPPSSHLSLNSRTHRRPFLLALLSLSHSPSPSFSLFRSLSLSLSLSLVLSLTLSLSLSHALFVQGYITGPIRRATSSGGAPLWAELLRRGRSAAPDYVQRYVQEPRTHHAHTLTHSHTHTHAVIALSHAPTLRMTALKSSWSAHTLTYLLTHTHSKTALLDHTHSRSCARPQRTGGLGDESADRPTIPKLSTSASEFRG